MPLSGAFAAYASPEPQSQSQAVATITGTVLDENNEPVIGASVFQKGTPGNAAATDVDGHFTLRVAPGAKLTVSYVGYKTIDIAAANGMTVYLQPTTEMLNELVAVGYGSQKRANLTGAVATVDVARVMDSRPTADVTKALQGAVPGLTITTDNGDINGTATMRIRGTGTLSNDEKSSPLIVVDGVPTEDLSFLDPADIEEISVLKDAASSAVYGTRAAFGVILIKTKTPDTKDRVSISYSNNFAWSQATVLPNYGTVPTQIKANAQANLRAGLDNELFGMYLDNLLPYAEAWYEQNGGQKAGYREMRPFQSWDDVGDYFVNPDGSGALYYADWDVTDIMFNSAAPSQKHNVSLEGVSGKTSYRLSFGYNERQGLMNFNPDKLRRYNANANIQTEIFSWLKAGARINFSEKEYIYPRVARNTYTYMWRWGSFFGPYGWKRDADGEQVDFRNDIAYRKQAGTYDDRTAQTRIQAWMEAKIVKGLNLHADFTYEITNWNCNSSYQPVRLWNSWGGNIAEPTTAAYPIEWSDAEQQNTRDDMWTMNVFATYENGWNNHNIKVMVGGTAEQEERNWFSAKRDYLMDINQPYLGLTTGGADGNGKYIENTITTRATAGFFGRINYDYKGIYLLELNGRYDGSSRFPANDQWAFFPSGSIGYRFSEESYFEKAKEVVSNGKIRASYGEIGNETVGDYMFLSKISAGSVNWLNSGGSYISAYDMPTLVSPTLKWERVCTTDVGVDLGFFDNSLNLTFDWFQRDTKDMLAPGLTLPSVVGAASPLENAGTLRTRGWELGIGWNHSFGDADVYVNASIYDGKTTVEKWNNPTQVFTDYYSGQVLGDIWGFETERYFEEYDFTGKDSEGNWIYAPGVADQTGLQSGTFVYGPGDIKFKDLNGDGVINGGDPNMTDENGNSIPTSSARNHGDLKVIGNSLPRYEYSFRLGGAYKGFDLDLYFQGVGKRDLWRTSSFVIPFARGVDATYDNQESYNTMEFDESGNVIGYNIDQANDYPCMFGGAGTTGTVSGISNGAYNFYPQSKYLMNMAYLRFKTLTFGYTIPANLTKKAYIQKARLYFTAENLCFLYNGNRKYPIDPEIWTGGAGTVADMNGNGTYGRTAPMMRSFSFGIQVTF